jgi:Flp pilus assembly protein TadB
MLRDSSTMGRTTKAIYTVLTIVIIACILILWIKAELAGIFIVIGIVLLPIIAIWTSVRWRRNHRSDADQ